MTALDALFSYLQSFPPHVVFVVAGPSASGKSAFALKGARLTKGGLINADSLQLYQGLPLLTAQPSPSDYQEAPHYLYNSFPPDHQGLSAAAWALQAHHHIQALQAKGQRPWIVGGTGFYLKALMQGLSPLPSFSVEEKQAWFARRFPGNGSFKEALTPAVVDALKKALQEADPPLNLQDPQRMLYALMIKELTGKPLSQWQKLPPLQSPYTFYRLLIWPSREQLHSRLMARFQDMMIQGVCQEVASFKFCTSPLRQAIGFRPVRALALREIGLEECTALYQQEAQRYVKRQRTWFAHQFSPHRIVPYAV